MSGLIDRTEIDRRRLLLHAEKRRRAALGLPLELTPWELDRIGLPAAPSARDRQRKARIANRRRYPCPH